MSISTANPQVATLSRYKFIAAGSETSVSGLDANNALLAYVAGKEQVYLNGVLLVRGSDYTATNGTSITGLTALVASDVLEVLTFSEFVIANAVDQNLVNAKGDIIVATADNTVTNLAVGNNGETIVADSSTSTGLRYLPLNSAGKNAVINGGMDIWQRGTSFASLTSSTLYTADRWLFKRLDGTTGGTVSRQSSTETGFQYAMRVQRNNANTGTGGLYVYNTIETINSIPLAGKTITLSFYALKGANFSASNLEVYVGYGTGTDQQMGSTGFTGQATVISTTQVLTTTSTRYTFTGTVPSNSTEVGMYLGFTPTGTAGAADYFDVSGVQIEIGSTATTFSRAGGTIQGELAACQRYYQRVNADIQYGLFSTGKAFSTGNVQQVMPLKVTMRDRPLTMDTSAASGFICNTGATDVTSITSLTINANFTNTNFLGIDVNKTSAFTVGAFYLLYSNNSTTSYIGVSAEL